MYRNMTWQIFRGYVMTEFPGHVEAKAAAETFDEITKVER